MDKHWSRLSEEASAEELRLYKEEPALHEYKAIVGILVRELPRKNLEAFVVGALVLRAREWSPARLEREINKEGTYAMAAIHRKKDAND